MASTGIALRRDTDVAKHRFHDIVGRTIAKHRDLQCLTVRQLADKVGCNPSTIQNAEDGHSCSLYLLVRIAEELDVPIDTLIPTEATK
jgi:transcriptional regulator with XRE-family HTH domain